jgi:glycosyltransferase involved in cell wall biosynthesis
MSGHNTFVFWQNMPTHHQSPWISVLAGTAGHEVIVALEGGISELRRNLGWRMPDYGVASVEIGLDSNKISRIVDSAGPDAFHVFGGLGAYPGVYSALKRCCAGGRKIGVMSEASSSNGFRGAARVCAGQLKRLRFGRHIDFVLGIGDGPDWFRRLGFDAARIFDFAYFPPFPSPDEEIDTRPWESRDRVRIIYVGMLVRAKGIDRLLNGLSRIDEDEWELALVGTGNDEEHFRSMTSRLGLSDRVRFCGALPNSEAMKVLRGADLLVLPTLSDGWGAVVNEALSRGVPVICSDKCGARKVITACSDIGSVYSSEPEMRAALACWIAKGRRTPDQRRCVMDRGRFLMPEQGAHYFLQVIQHVYGGGTRPTAPWLVAADHAAHAECRSAP